MQVLWDHIVNPILPPTIWSVTVIVLVWCLLWSCRVVVDSTNPGCRIDGPTAQSVALATLLSWVNRWMRCKALLACFWSSYFLLSSPLLQSLFNFSGILCLCSGIHLFDEVSNFSCLTLLTIPTWYMIY